MFCSGCGSGLAPGHYFTVPIEVCTGCGGCWLEEGRLKWIIEIGPKSIPSERLKRATRYRITSKPAYRLDDREVRRIVKCPYCIGVMRPVNYSANSGVAIYKCTSDHGVWVPKDGIDRLVTFIGTWDRYLRQQGSCFVHLAQFERKRFLRKISY